MNSVALDGLTGLIDRQEFHREIEKECLKSDSDNDAFLVLINIDHMEKINQKYGMRTGDKIIKDVSQRLKSIDGNASIGRFCGDMFGVILRMEGSSKGVRKSAAKIVVSAIASSPCELGDVRYSCSIGCAKIESAESENHIEIDSVFYKAGAALKRAKRQYGHSICMYDSERDKIETGGYEQYMDLMTALQKGEFRVFYQARVNMITGETDGAEALIRWIHPERGLIPPIAFIDTMENSGLIIPVGYWLIQQVCEDIKTFKEHGMTGRVGINLSYSQFEDDGITKKIERMIEMGIIDPYSIDFELTESQKLSENHAVFDFMMKMKKHGISFSLDDFGTGYSSLSVLHNLPVSKMKIDRSFIEQAMRDNNSRDFLISIIQMAGILNKEIVAEGIEEKDQEDLLIENGVEMAQGYMYGKPVPIEEFIEKHLSGKRCIAL